MKRWKPDLHCPSIFDVPWDQLYQDGFTHVVFDLDNTLGLWGMSHLPEDALALLTALKTQGFCIGVLSNSALKGRKKRLTAQLNLLDIPLVSSAVKPFLAGYRTLLRHLDGLPTKSVMVGDQWWTDIIGAKRLSMFAVWVDPIDAASEPWWVRWHRRFERRD